MSQRRQGGRAASRWLCGEGDLGGGDESWSEEAEEQTSRERSSVDGRKNRKIDIKERALHPRAGAIQAFFLQTPYVRHI